MLDYATWPIKRNAVTSLLLDQQNPRLPQAGGGLTQRQIIDELVTHDSVYELAKDISRLLVKASQSHCFSFT
jgi:hypothetical protein